MLRLQRCREAKAFVILERFDRSLDENTDWFLNGLAMDWPWIGNGLGMDWEWIGHGLGMDWAWIGHGLGMDWPWIGHLPPSGAGSPGCTPGS